MTRVLIGRSPYPINKRTASRREQLEASSTTRIGGSTGDSQTMYANNPIKDSTRNSGLSSPEERQLFTDRWDQRVSQRALSLDLDGSASSLTP
ncbi:hypothetical protein TNIN_246811 [Trichonephila inaurata madagascariensis]|uniref:Uncharacterized protein n=1 Tax=Trichonephila inaurata madagascariensis TaxID=2747483 RepID=A0A8X6XMC8_9ARAC|nr:hypothetical protein TNIN_246811 [Trichonephila inaurata madagascariensis]